LAALSAGNGAFLRIVTMSFIVIMAAIGTGAWEFVADGVSSHPFTIRIAPALIVVGLLTVAFSTKQD
jgi:hypothetical protein